MSRAGFVLAGGASRRMGQDKALLEFEGVALAAWIADRVRRAAGCVSLVGGGEKYAHLGYPILPERFPGSGPLSGIEAALRLGGAEWSLVVGCDMPGIRTEWLAEILDAAEESGAQAVYVRGSGGEIEPLCAAYHASCLPAAQEMLACGQYRTTGIFNRINGLELRASWADQLRNVNTPGEWEALKGRR
jgi:molybdopterin-guanine dinucleotide biosynthesis protein A